MYYIYYESKEDGEVKALVEKVPETDTTKHKPEDSWETPGPMLRVSRSARAGRVAASLSRTLRIARRRGWTRTAPTKRRRGGDIKPVLSGTQDGTCPCILSIQDGLNERDLSSLVRPYSDQQQEYEDDQEDDQPEQVACSPEGGEEKKKKETSEHTEDSEDPKEDPRDPQEHPPQVPHQAGQEQDQQPDHPEDHRQRPHQQQQQEEEKEKEDSRKTYILHRSNMKRAQQHNQPMKYQTDSSSAADQGAGGIKTKPSKGKMISLKSHIGKAGGKRRTGRSKLAPVVGNRDIRTYFLKGRVGEGSKRT